MTRFWRPSALVDDAARRRGLAAFLGDGICSQVRESLHSGPLLVGYALLLGVSNTGIGLIAAIGPLTQILQLPTVAMIERWRRRKAITWVAALSSRLCWTAALVLPWTVPAGARLPALIGCLVLASGFSTVAGAAWTPWIRDFLPENVIAGAFARRLSLATGASAVLGLAAGFAIDALPRAGMQPASVYTLVFGTGIAFGLAGLFFLARIPEPVMPETARRPWADVFRAPLVDPDFRPVMVFLACWIFAANLTAPFFSVYLLRRFGLPMAWVVGLTVLSQATTALAFRAWGAVADRFDLRTVMRVSGIGFLLTVAAWPFINLLASRPLVLGLLLLLHAVAGLAAAGVNLGTGTLALQVAPRGQAAAYLATNALISGAAAALAPALAGVSADWLETQRLTVTVQWSSTWGRDVAMALRPLDFHGLDFIWAVSVGLGLYAVHRLLALPAHAPGRDRAVLSAVLGEMGARVRTPLRALSTVPGVREVVELPFSLVSRLVPERRQEARERARRAFGLTRRRPPE
jgi:MFS family permease